MVTFEKYALFILYPTNIFSFLFNRFLISLENILFFVVLSMKLVHVYTSPKIPCTIVIYFFILYDTPLIFISCILRRFKCLECILCMTLFLKFILQIIRLLKEEKNFRFIFYCRNNPQCSFYFCSVFNQPLYVCPTGENALQRICHTTFAQIVFTYLSKSRYVLYLFKKFNQTILRLDDCFYKCL